MVEEGTLLLHEEILLLALRDKAGTIAPGAMYQYAVGGAILAELLLRECIQVDDSRKKKLVELVRARRIRDPLLSECLHKIQDAGRRASLQTWVARFARTRDLKHRIARELCSHGILRVDEGKVLLIFTRKVYPEVNPKPERALIERLRKAIFTDGKEVDPRTVVLVSLANSSGLLKVTFDRKKLRARKDRIARIVDGELTGKATKQVIEATQAAVMVACVMPAIMAATSASH